MQQHTCTHNDWQPQVAVLTAGRDRPYALGLAETLVKRGIPFDFIGGEGVDVPWIRDHPGLRFLNIRNDQDPAAPLTRKILRVLQYYAKLIRYAQTARPRVFHILWNNKFEWFDRTLLMLFYRLCGRRIVFTAHNVNAGARDGCDSWANRATLRIQYRLCDHIFVHTQAMRQELLGDFGMPPDRVSVIPFGINNTVPVTPLTRLQARSRLGLGPTDRVVLFFGNIAAYKGLEFLVEAFEMLAPEDADLRLLIVGRPKGAESYWEGVKTRIDSSAHTQRVLVHPRYVADEETEIYFKAADVLVLPYTHIFQSGVLFLGYSFGLPVLAADVGAMKEDIVDGRTGASFRPRDPTDLARVLRAHFRSDLYQNLEVRGPDIQAYANERYSWAKVGEITAKVYDELEGVRTAERKSQSADRGQRTADR